MQTDLGNVVLFQVTKPVEKNLKYLLALVYSSLIMVYIFFIFIILGIFYA